MKGLSRKPKSKRGEHVSFICYMCLISSGSSCFCQSVVVTAAATVHVFAEKRNFIQSEYDEDQSDVIWVISARVWRQMMHYGNCRTKVRDLNLRVSPPRNKLTSTCVSYRKNEFKGTVHPNKDSFIFSHPLLHD